MEWKQLSDRTVKATRKAHRCEWCPDIIEAGQPAHHRSYTCDRGMESAYTHPECWEALGKSGAEILDMDGFQPHEQERGVAL